MSSLAHSFALRQQQGFAVYVLNNDEVELAVAPELGAKIISLKNLQSGREWMWHPPGGLKLFRNSPCDDFAKSPLAGADECLPTIAPCRWQGRQLPDHGEVWNVAWTVDAGAWENGILKTSVRLEISPFEFTRSIELRENEIHLGYQLNNLSAGNESFLWAFHPLLELQPGDRLEIPPETCSLLNNPAWRGALAAAVPEKNSAKDFATPLSEGRVAIRNQKTGDRLQFEWNPGENDTLGLWLSRGGWHGHHHFSIEPANAGTDSLALAAEQGHHGIVPAGEAVTWQIRLYVGS
jgi:hypothetical protein